MRVLHTADWQLGLRAAQAGVRAPEVRAERLVALARTVELALAERVELVIVAGDVFDHHEVSDDVLRELQHQLGRLAPVPVVLLPGNHDPAVPGGVWDRRLCRELGTHVRILDRAEEIEIAPGVALYPCPLRQKRSTHDPTAWIPPRAGGDTRLRIGIAHGALDSLQVRSNFPISRDRAELVDLDYLALGDWHGVLTQGRAAYPGTFEQTGFGEKLPGFVLLTELDRERRREPSIERHRIGRFRWLQLETEVRERTDVESLRDTIANAGAPSDLLLRVWVRSNGLDESARILLEQVEQQLAESAFFFEWRCDHREIAPWAFEEGVLADVDESLAALAAGGPLPEGLEDLAEVDPEIAREARLSLRRLASGALEMAIARS